MKIKVIDLFIVISLLRVTVCYGEISGYVKDYRGNPVAGAMVTFIDESYPTNSYSATTESDGRYEIRELTTNVVENKNLKPLDFTLYQNHPNPFNPETTITFNLNNNGYVNLDIYNALGQKVRTLIHDFYNTTGIHTVKWNGLDDGGLAVGSGIYLYQLRSNDQIASKKMLLLDSGGYSMTGSFSYLKSYRNTIDKLSVNTEIGTETTYRIIITGENIEDFEKTGITLRYTDPSVDFIVARSESGYHLSIVHTNDIHSVLEPIANSGGAAKVATMARILRNQRQNVLMLDAGDRFTRTSFNAIINETNNQIINLLEYDCMTIGNWDLSFGAELLADFIRGLNSCVVSCNINVEKEPLLEGLFEPYIIQDVGGHKIGLVGVATANRGSYSNIDNIIIDDVIPSVQTVVDELILQDVDIIVLISHVGYSEDKQIAREVDHIDIIVGGHSHTLLANTDERAQGPYPTELTSPSGEPVLIVQSGSYNQYVGCLDVIFNENGVACYWTGDSYIMDSSIPEDETVLTIVDDMNEKLEDSSN